MKGSNMKTVKDFKAKGGVLTVGDKVKPACPDTEWHVKDDDTLKSFAWRPNTGVKPEFDGVVEVELYNGHTWTGSNEKATSWDWAIDTGISPEISKWRPHLPSIQTKAPECELKKADDECIAKLSKYFMSDLIPTETPEEKEALDAIERKSPYDVDAHCSVEEYIPNKPSPYPDVDAHCSGDDVSVVRPILEDIASYLLDGGETKETKPIFTQAMADAGELPPVGSTFMFSSLTNPSFNDFRLCEALFNDDDVLFYRVIDCRFDGGHGFSSIYCGHFKPIDTRTSKQKAIDEMVMTAIESEDDIAKSIIYEACVKLAKAGYRKC